MNRAILAAGDSRGAAPGGARRRRRRGALRSPVVAEHSVSFRHFSTLIDGAEQDVPALRELERRVAAPSDLTPAEAAALRGRIGQALARLVELSGLDVHGLIARCNAGDQDACLELDRRGVEPPVLEPDYPGPLPLGTA
jgi:hypothetical protein